MAILPDGVGCFIGSENMPAGRCMNGTCVKLACSVIPPSIDCSNQRMEDFTITIHDLLAFYYIYSAMELSITGESGLHRHIRNVCALMLPQTPRLMFISEMENCSITSLPPSGLSTIPGLYIV